MTRGFQPGIALAYVLGLGLVSHAAWAWDYSDGKFTVRIDSTATLATGMVVNDKKTPLSEIDGGPAGARAFTTAAAPANLGILTPLGTIVQGAAPGWGQIFLNQVFNGTPFSSLGEWALLGAIPSTLQNQRSPFAGPPGPFLLSYTPGYTEGANSDLARLNFRPGDFYSGLAKVSHDVEVKYDNFTVFFRGYYFYDAVLNDQNSPEVTKLGNDTRKYAGLNFVPLDSFIDGKFDVAGHAIDVRVGKQVINWGESTFLLGGINAFTPIDASAFHRPGTELKEVFLPQWLASASVDLFDGISAQGWYQLHWDSFYLDPAETYFSGSSAAGLINRGTGGMGTLPTLLGQPYGPRTPGFLAIGGTSYTGTFHRNCQPGYTDVFGPAGQLQAECAQSPYVNFTTPLPTNGSGLATRLALGDNSFLHRIYDQKPPDDGQFGVSLKWYAESLNSTEFDIFYSDYNSRIPAYGNSTGASSPMLYPTPQVIIGNNNDVLSNTLYTGGFAPIYVATLINSLNPTARNPDGSIKFLDPLNALLPTSAPGITPAQAAADRQQLLNLANVPIANPGNLINPWTCRIPGQYNTTNCNTIKNYGDFLQARSYTLGNPANAYIVKQNAFPFPVPNLVPGIEAPALGNYLQAFLEYPKHIHNYGFSFNTTWGDVGIQGEFSYKQHDFVQLNDVEIILGVLNASCFWPATFGALGTAVFEGGPSGPGTGSQLANANRSGQQFNCDPSKLTTGQNAVVHGYMRTDDFTINLGTTQILRPTVGIVQAIGADQILLVTEFAMIHYPNLPKFNQLQLLQSNEVGDSSALAGVLSLAPLYTGFPTGDSGGAVIYSILEYDNVFSTAVTLNPTVALKWDIYGIAPGPLTQYVRNRKQLSVGVDGTYQNRIKGTLAYSTSWGGGLASPDRGQGFVSASVSYSF